MTLLPSRKTRLTKIMGIGAASFVLATGVQGVPAASAATGPVAPVLTPSGEISNWSGTTIGPMGAVYSSVDGLALVGGSGKALLVLKQDGHSWTHVQTIDGFSNAVAAATDGTRIVVANDGSPDQLSVFDPVDGNWIRSGLVDPGMDVSNISLDGDRFVVSGISSNQYRTSVFAKQQSGWVLDGGWSGHGAVAIHGNQAVSKTGVLYSRGATGWVASYPFGFPSFNGGVSRVVFDGQTLAMGGRDFNAALGVDTDIVRVWSKRSDGSWWGSSIADPDGAGPNQFGSTLALDGSRLLVGQDTYRTGKQDRAFVYERASDGWTWAVAATLLDPEPAGTEGANNSFASGVALSDSKAGVVSSGYNRGYGAWYTFDAHSGQLEGALNHPASGANQRLGVGGTAVDGDLAVIKFPGGVRVFHATAVGWEPDGLLNWPGTSTGSTPGLSKSVGSVVAHRESVFVRASNFRSDLTREDVLLRFDKSGTDWTVSEQIAIPTSCATYRDITDFRFAGDDIVGVASKNTPTLNCPFVLRRSGSTWTSVSSDMTGLAGGVMFATTKSGFIALGSWNDRSQDVVIYAPTVLGGYRLFGKFDRGDTSVARIAITDTGSVALAGSRGLRVWEPPAVGTAYVEATVPTISDTSTSVTSLGRSLLLATRDRDGMSAVETLLRGGDGWEIGGRVDSPDAQLWDGFGEYTAASDDRLLVSAHSWDSPGGADSGKIYSYRIVTPTAPGPPNAISVESGDHSATISWLRPADDGGSPILGYTVTATPGGKTCSTDSADALTCTITGLDNGVNYTFTVTARNAVGSSPPPPPSDPCTTCNAVVGPLPDPVRIENGGIERSDDGTKATVNWLAAAPKDPALPITGYLVTATSTDDPDRHTCRTDGALSCTVEGLIKGLDYTFTVQALTDAGSSPVTKPGSPSAVTATLASGQSVKVAWTAPAVDGGTQITGYKVTASGDGGVCTTSAALTCTIQGLTRGATYTFTVVATNAKGDSDPSLPSNELRIPTDTSAPVVAGAADRDADAPGWYRAPVTVSWSAVDDTDGVLAAPASIGVGEGADQTVASDQVCDSAGNCAAGSFGPLSVDLTKPTVQASVSGSANGAGWRNETPSVTFECTDALSGIAECPSPESVGDGQDQTVTGTGTDRAGNSETAKVTGLNVDTHAPRLSGKPAVDVPASGWFSGDVPITWVCSDDLSGVAEDACPGTSTLAGEGSGLTIAAVTTDRAGNTTTEQSEAVNIDRTAPSTGVSAPNGWNASTVSLTLNPTDTLSGVKSTRWAVDGGDPVTGTDVTVTGEGRHVLRFHSVDNAGNAEDPVEVSVLIDSSGPQVVATVDPQPNAQGWNNAPVTVSFTCTDGDSGVTDCTAPVTVTGEGAGQVITGEGVDAAGNRTLAQATINLDLTAPAITSGIDTTANPAGWYNSPVPVQWQCSDGLSGVAECSDPAVLTETHPGPVTGSVTDTAGNTTSTTQTALQIDTTPPVVAINGPEDGGIYSLGSAPDATCSASDARSGLADECQISVTGGNVNHVGSFTASATATDKAGNSTRVTVTYRVQYAWNGFDQPINDTGHQVNQTVSVFKAGSTVPVKFTLTGPDGQPIKPVTPPAWITPAKGVSTNLPVDETVYTDPADSGNTYKGTGGHWAYNWKTDKAQTGNYWRIGVRLDDGTTHHVNIALR